VKCCVAPPGKFSFDLHMSVCMYVSSTAYYSVWTCSVLSSGCAATVTTQTMLTSFTDGSPSSLLRVLASLMNFRIDTDNVRDSVE